MLDIHDFVDYLIWDLEGGDKVWNDPDAGLTKFGFAAKYHPDLDIEKLTAGQAHEETLRRYHYKYRTCNLPMGYDALALDWVFNAGPAFIPDIQRFVGTAPDGHIGPKTAARFFTLTEREGGLLNGLAIINTQRIIAYEEKRRYHLYRRGWLNRINKAALWIATVSMSDE